MLNENIRTIRKSKGLSQQDLAIRLNVVRQTVSKWEKGLSVPDSEMLILISDVLETPVSILIGENISEYPTENLKSISEKLEAINLQLANNKIRKRKFLQALLIILCFIILIIFLFLIRLKSPYLNWSYNNPEITVLRVNFHILEWLFVRIAPIIMIFSIIGIILIRKKF
ncbi:XRE family transcriptional regulator [Peptacetobacter hominis]|uniref:XRE family transcriptional regulator n=1 Tax=Peptacetobacter hominis TaxID=2743610 RepID=A0A544QVS9_9FIRM|nr:helix-turn-helix transcriptional regulator [Peptacetobacter hominis]TQQ84786.1 XRE family transcriptional regulator [Peptacetobacter hominis]